ncbi:hypothetical protein [Novosphingobium sp. THN1]|nr:hypothetical protein [Novosphingobium sp. THN1]
MTARSSVTPAQAGAHDLSDCALMPASMDPGLRRGDAELEWAL